MKNLNSIPLFNLETTTFNISEDSELKVNFNSVLGQEINHNLTLNYKIFSLDQEVIQEGSETVQNASKFSINITNKFVKPGNYYLSVNSGEIKLVTTERVETIPEDPETPEEVENANSNSTLPVKKEPKTRIVKSETAVFVHTYSSLTKFQVMTKIKIVHLKYSVTSSSSNTKDGDNKEM